MGITRAGPIRSFKILATILAVIPLSVVAQSQQPVATRLEQTVRSRLISERNRLGLVQFCFSRGLVGDEAVSKQRRVVADLRGEAEIGAAEEGAGRNGVIAYLKSQATLAQSAQAQGMTLETKCAQMALSLIP